MLKLPKYAVLFLFTLGVSVYAQTVGPAPGGGGSGSGGVPNYLLWEGATQGAGSGFSANLPSSTSPTLIVPSGTNPIAALEWPTGQSTYYAWWTWILSPSYVLGNVISFTLETRSADSTHAAIVTPSWGCTTTGPFDNPTFTPISTFTITNAAASGRTNTTSSFTPTGCGPGNRVSLKLAIDTNTNSMTSVQDLVSLLIPGGATGNIAGPAPSGTGLVVVNAGVASTVTVSGGVSAVQGNGVKAQLSTGSTTTNDCVKFDSNGNTVDAGAGCGSGNAVYSTQSSAVTANISATNMVASTGAIHGYLFSWTISLTTAGSSCTTSTSVTLNAIFTDPNTSSPVTEALGTFTLATNGNGTVGFISSGADNILAKSGTAVQYSTSSYTAGSGCSPAPAYQVSPALVQLW